MSHFHSLTIDKIHRETDKAISITFDVPSSLNGSFAFKAGQYITIKKELNGVELRRSYSICETPKSNALKVVVKEVENGTFSVYANTQLKEGDVLEVMPPEGRFVFDPTVNKGAVAAFAAGSGITPIMSIAKTVLQETNDDFILVYGNKSVTDTIFYAELTQLQETHPDRFHLHFVFSQAQEEDALFGRIDRSTVNFVTKNKHKDLNITSYYLCGPEAMINTVSETLAANEVAKENIHFELFTSSDDYTTTSNENLDGKTQVKVLVDDEEFEFTMSQDKTILESALKEDIDAPYSCQGGICSSCIARITEGAAVMDKNQILTDGELEEGLVLTCQAHPTTPTIVVDYDDV